MNLILFRGIGPAEGVVLKRTRLFAFDMNNFVSRMGAEESAPCPHRIIARNEAEMQYPANLSPSMWFQTLWFPGSDLRKQMQQQK